jgi:predicted 3-demethylubiquinone-9 3-methyltransferase (glyoxalase superfamily)
MLSITPFLWFDTQAEEAMNFYATVFPNARTVAVHRAGERVQSVTFELEGQRFMGLNAGPLFRFNEAVSFFVSCDTQQDVDTLWEKLLVNGGTPTQCGWLKDQFGLSWQIIPAILPKLLGDPDRAKAGRAMQAMLQMVKIDGPALQRAFDGA